MSWREREYFWRLSVEPRGAKLWDMEICALSKIGMSGIWKFTLGIEHQYQVEKRARERKSVALSVIQILNSGSIFTLGRGRGKAICGGFCGLGRWVVRR